MEETTNISRPPAASALRKLTAVQMDRARRTFLETEKRRYKSSISDIMRDALDMYEARVTIERYIRTSIARNAVHESEEGGLTGRDKFITWCMMHRKNPRTNATIGELAPIAPEYFVTLETYQMLSLWHMHIMPIAADNRAEALKTWIVTTLEAAEYYVIPETYTLPMFTDDNPERVTLYTPATVALPYTENRNSIVSFGGASDAVSVGNPLTHDPERPGEGKFSDQR